MRQVKCQLRNQFGDEYESKVWEMDDLPQPLSHSDRSEEALAKSESTSLFYESEDDARLVAGQASKQCKVSAAKCDINMPMHRHRLWSWSDNMIAHFWSHFDDARRMKEQLMVNWFVDLSNQ